MANFLIGSAGNVVTGTENNDTLETVSSLSTSTIAGLGGDDTLKISSTAFTDINVRLGAGDDVFTSTNSADIKSSFFAFGDGDDTFTLNAESAGLQGSTIRGNEGQDTIAITFTGLSATASSVKIEGNAGNDTITLSSDEILRDVTVGAGKGNDTLSYLKAGSLKDGELAGGFGEDTITATQGFDSSLIRLGQGNNDGTDSADSLHLKGVVRNSTVKAGAGNDTISATFDANSTSSVIEGNAGEDTITLTASAVASAFIVRGGADNDTIELVGSADLNQSGDIYGGAGDDTISGSFTGYNVYGGDGADVMEWSDSATQYHYTEGDSELGSIDNIELSGAGAADSLLTRYASAVTAMTATSFTAAAAGDVTSADVVVQSGGLVNFTGAAVPSGDISAAADLLDSVLTTGQAVAFVMSAANMELTDGDDLYLFVKGAADDTVIKLGSAAAVLSADSGHYNLEGGTSAEDLTFTI